MALSNRNNRFFVLLFALLISTACSASSNKPDGSDVTFEGPTFSVTATEKVPVALQQALGSASAMDGDTLSTAYPAPPVVGLNYDATQAAGLDLIQGSALSLNDNELASLAEEGFTISKRQTFPSFAYGYKSIYSEDLPLYVSADSILEAVHRTFDSLLKLTEEQVLIDELTRFLNGMRSNLPERVVDPQLSSDADLYLTVAASLLSGELVSPVAGADANEVAALFDLAVAASGHKTVRLFGAIRDEDFSQFKPRGHYVDSEMLERYFKTMMWLGRVDLRLIETQSDGTQLFRRRQFDAAVALYELMDEDAFALWRHIDSTVGTFVGERDSMSPQDMKGLLDALKVSSLEQANTLSDDSIADEIARGGWGAQRIASRIIMKGTDSTETLPLDRSFLLFGQRYTVDSHTFVNVTFDRVDGRLMPKPLDVAFAALGNNAALRLLSGEFVNQSYVAGLAKTRALVDAHEDAYWEGSLYTRWLDALRSVSINNDSAPIAVPQTAAWQSRLLATQLGSWSQLRRDTILYVKQSYTGGAVCEFPDAYIDPFPQFYAKLRAFADAMDNVAQGFPSQAAQLKAQIQDWAVLFGEAMSNLQTMAENQRSGVAHSQQLIDFINDAVSWDESPMCGGTSYENLAGWYLRLYLNEYAGLEYDPTVADVHTQPFDEGGNDVGRILHAGIGMPRLMVVTAETCQGPRAYAGLAYSYGELITEQWRRLNDQDWAEEIGQNPFPDPEWMNDALSE